MISVAIVQQLEAQLKEQQEKYSMLQRQSEEQIERLANELQSVQSPYYFIYICRLTILIVF